MSPIPLTRRPYLLAFAFLLALPAAAQEPLVVTPGSGHLDLSRLQPDTTTYTITVVQGPMRQPIGTVTRTVVIDEDAGEIALGTEMEMMGNKFSDLTRAAWPALTTRSHRSSNPQRRLDFDVADGALTGEHEPAGGGTEAFELALDGPIFDSSLIGEIAPLLPLEEGFIATIPAYEYDAGGLTDFTVRVLGSEKLVREGRPPVETWVVETRWEGSQQVPQFYLAKDTHELVRIRIAPQEGVEILIDAE